MAKQRAFVQFFVGDFLKDTQLMSNEMKGAYTALYLRLLGSVNKGVITNDITELQQLLQVSYSSVSALLEKFSQHADLEVENLPDGNLKISHEGILKQAAKAAAKAAAGEKGMRRRYEKEKNYANPDITPVITNDITNVITHNDNDIVIVDKGYEDKGGKGEKEEKGKDPHKPITAIAMMPVDDCLEIFLTHPDEIVSNARRQLGFVCRDLLNYTGIDGLNEPLTRRWGEAFNREKKSRMESTDTLGKWSNHFKNWVNLQIAKGVMPEKIHEHATATKNRNNTAGATNRQGASVDDIRSLKRDTGAGPTQSAEYAEVVRPVCR